MSLDPLAWIYENLILTTLVIIGEVIFNMMADSEYHGQQVEVLYTLGGQI